MRYGTVGTLGALALSTAVGSAEAQKLPVEVQVQHGEGFGYLNSVRELPDGRVLIADPLGQMFGALDLSSGAFDAWGREGQGPEEWGQPDAVHPLPDGQSLLVDLGNTRLTVVGADGSFGETYSLVQESRSRNPGRPSPPTMLMPRMTDRAGRLYMPVRSFDNLDDSTGVSRSELGGSLEPLGKVKPQETRQTGDENNVSITPVPMSPQDDWAAGPDGTVVFVRSDGYYLEIHGPDDRVRRTEPMNPDLIRPDDDDKYAYLENQSSAGITMSVSIDSDGQRQMSMQRGGFGGRGEPNLKDYDWPDRMPAFRAGSTRIGPDGRIFVGRTVHAGESSRFDVFDGSGRMLGYAEFGPNVSIVGFGADGAVYLSRVDEFGLHWLQKVKVG